MSLIPQACKHGIFPAVACGKCNSPVMWSGPCPCCAALRSRAELAEARLADAAKVSPMCADNLRLRERAEKAEGKEPLRRPRAGEGRP